MEEGEIGITIPSRTLGLMNTKIIEDTGVTEEGEGGSTGGLEEVGGEGETGITIIIINTNITINRTNNNSSSKEKEKEMMERGGEDEEHFRSREEGTYFLKMRKEEGEEEGE